MDESLLVAQISDNSVLDTWKEDSKFIDIYAHVKDYANSCPFCGNLGMVISDADFDMVVAGMLVNGKSTRIHYKGIKYYNCNKCKKNFRDSLNTVSAFNMHMTEDAYRFVNIIDGDVIVPKEENGLESIGYWGSSKNLRNDYDNIKESFERDARIRKLYRSGISKLVIWQLENIAVSDIEHVLADSYIPDVVKEFGVKLGKFDYKAIEFVDCGMNIEDVYEQLKLIGYGRKLKDLESKLNEVRVSISTAYQLSVELKDILWFDLVGEVNKVLKLSNNGR